MKSKMGNGYTPLFNNGIWSIEQYTNKYTNKECLVVVSDDCGVCDWPIFYDEYNRVAFDCPERIPEHIKLLTRRLYINLRGK